MLILLPTGVRWILYSIDAGLCARGSHPAVLTPHAHGRVHGTVTHAAVAAVGLTGAVGDMTRLALPTRGALTLLQHTVTVAVPHTRGVIVRHPGAAGHLAPRSGPARHRIAPADVVHGGVTLAVE